MEERTVIQPRPLGSVKPGTRLNGIYQIEKMIAQGGMGEVYRGFNVQTADIVAIKMIRPEFSDNDDVMELFRREASILHNLLHEAIVRYFLFSVDPVIGRAYLAMEFVDGPSLRDRLTSGPLSLPDVTILRKRIASALETAHRLGVVHRDISSDNIILPNADVCNVKIIDFGIARSLEVGKETIIGSGFAGKYNYVSPEQLGLAGGDVTFKSDIYSFGLVLAEATRGHALDMNGSQAEVIDKRRVVPDLSDIDPTIRPLLQAMLQPRPENRPASMAAIAEWTELAAPAPPARRGKVRKSAARPAATARQPREFLRRACRRHCRRRHRTREPRWRRFRLQARSLAVDAGFRRARRIRRPDHLGASALASASVKTARRSLTPGRRSPGREHKAAAARGALSSANAAACSRVASGRSRADRLIAAGGNAQRRGGARGGRQSARTACSKRGGHSQRRAAPRAAGGDRPTGGDRRSALPGRASQFH